VATVRTFEWQNIPTVLQQIDRWIVWKEVPDEKGNKAKVPFNPYRGIEWNCDPLASDNWLSFSLACDAANHYGVGIGLTFDGSDGLFFLDLDNKTNDPEIAALHRQAIERFETYTEQSPSGLGYHLIGYGHKPEGLALPRGVELYDRDRYATFTGWTLNGKELRNAQWLLDLLPRKDSTGQINLGEFGGATSALDRLSANKAFAAECARVREAPAGTRNNTLNAASFALGTFVGAGTLLADDVARDLYDAALSCGLGSEEARKTIESGINSGMRRPRASLQPDPIIPVGLPTVEALQAAQATPVQRAISGAPALAKRKRDPLTDLLRGIDLGTIPAPGEPWAPQNLPGLMGQIEDFLLAQSKMPNRLAAHFGALGWFAGVTGLAYGINGAGQNIYLILTARSSSGKTATVAGLDTLNSMIDNGHPEEQGMAFQIADSFQIQSDATAAASIMRELKGRFSVYCLIDEVHKNLGAMLSPRAQELERGKQAMWLKLYDGANTHKKLSGIKYSKAENDVQAIGPRAYTIAGMTTKKEFYKLLSEDQAGNGFLSRFIILEDDDRQKEMQFSPNRIPPLELVKAARSCMTECARISKMVDNRINVTFDADIVQRVQQFELDISKLAFRLPETYAELIGRAAQSVNRIASLIATAENPGSPRIHAFSFDYAVRLVMSSIWSIMRRFANGGIGDEGGNETKQDEAFQEAIEDYFGLSADVLATYRCTEEMRMQMIVSKRYFSQRLSRNAAFYKDQRKARFAIDLAIRDAISGGLIEPIKYGRSAEYYKILME
jgi:hypothetical protein